MKFLTLFMTILLFLGCAEVQPTDPTTQTRRADATEKALSGEGGFEGTTLPLDYDGLASKLAR
jgi:hypothetical protein